MINKLKNFLLNIVMINKLKNFILSMVNRFRSEAVPSSSAAIVNLGPRKPFMTYLHARNLHMEGISFLTDEQYDGLKGFLVTYFPEFPGFKVIGEVLDKDFDDAYDWIDAAYTAGELEPLDKLKGY